jgi:hypothetical protein
VQPGRREQASAAPPELTGQHPRKPREHDRSKHRENLNGRPLADRAADRLGSRGQAERWQHVPQTEYKGIYALLLKEGAIDWRTGEAADMNLYFDEAIDIHHIFPKAWCEMRGIKPSTYNSIVNETPLTARTNRVIGGRAPSEYLERLANSAGLDADMIRKHVSTHLADADPMARDDFEAFFADRDPNAALSGLWTHLESLEIQPSSDS